MVKELPLFESGSITMSIPLLSEQTLYTKFGDFIAIPFEWATGGLVVILIVFGTIKRKKSNES
jgi:apolipoprotein N-acyltransferase